MLYKGQYEFYISLKNNPAMKDGDVLPAFIFLDKNKNKKVVDVIVDNINEYYIYFNMKLINREKLISRNGQMDRLKEAAEKDYQELIKNIFNFKLILREREF